jgi:hypothetical protein
VSSAVDSPATPGTVIRKLPPVAEMALASMVLVIIGTIYLAASIGSDPTLAIPLALQAVATVLLLAAAGVTSRIDDFAWRVFWVVARWSLLGYAVIAGMIEFVFIKNDTPGGQLATLTFGLVLFVLAVVVILAFSVARYQPSETV